MYATSTDFFRAKGVDKAIVKLDEWLVYKMKKSAEERYWG
jgi:hypothetical protein